MIPQPKEMDVNPILDPRSCPLLGNTDLLNKDTSKKEHPCVIPSTSVKIQQYQSHIITIIPIDSTFINLPKKESNASITSQFTKQTTERSKIPTVTRSLPNKHTYNGDPIQQQPKLLGTTANDQSLCHTGTSTKCNIYVVAGDEPSGTPISFEVMLEGREIAIVVQNPSFIT